MRSKRRNEMWCAEVKAKKDIPLLDRVIKEGTTITVTKANEGFALWVGDGIYSLPDVYIGETVRVVCEN